MKTPICKICQNSELLCSGCQKKLENGEIKKHDVEVARALYEMTEKFPVLNKAGFDETIKLDGLTVIVVPKGTAGQMIGRGGIFIKELSSKLDQKIKVVEETPDEKEMIKKVLFPAKLLGVNIFYGPNKQEMYKVRVPKGDKRKLMEVQALESLFSKLLDGKASIVFE